MKKILLFLCCFLFSIDVYAKDTIKDMNIDIYIDNNGTATIKEKWETSVSSSKYTEWYKQYFNLGNSEIKDLKVSMNGTDYTTIDDWNIDASFEQKKYKAGIHYVSEGNEICWGMSNYGDNTYTIEYKITNFVNNVDSDQIVYWAIVPQEFDFPVDKIYVRIYSDFKYDQNWDVWGYGYGGYAYVYDGYIEMSTEHGLNDSEYMVVLIKFPGGTFNTSSTLNDDFDHYYHLAQEGSSPQKQSFLSSIRNYISMIFSAVFFIIFLGFIFKSASSSGNKAGTKKLDYTNAPKKLPKDSDINAFRDIPCEGDVAKGYWVSAAYDIYKNKNDFLGTLLLKWINENKVEVSKRNSGIFKKEETVIVLKENQTFDNFQEERMYHWMATASKDNILEKNEFKKYCNNNYKTVLKWFDDYIDDETERLVKTRELTIDTKTTLGFTSNKYVITPVVREDAIKLAGLKKFLNEFTNVKDKSAIEVKLLNKYLMYAQMFGIAKKVAKEFKELYPDVFTDTTYDQVIFVHDFSTTSVSAATTARSRAESYSAGGGGFSSFGGGGGSFGGGGGGGAR